MIPLALTGIGLIAIVIMFPVIQSAAESDEERKRRYMDEAMDDYWYDTWAYVNAEDIAPLLIGEWGGHMDGGKNQQWMELLRDYMINHHINHTFWCLNTNSGDTGGLWAGIGYDQAASKTNLTWDADKYALFEKSLWQTLKTGKYIGLDHQKALGTDGSGISVSEF